MWGLRRAVLLWSWSPLAPQAHMLLRPLPCACFELHKPSSQKVQQSLLPAWSLLPDLKFWILPLPLPGCCQLGHCRPVLSSLGVDLSRSCAALPYSWQDLRLFKGSIVEVVLRRSALGFPCWSKGSSLSSNAGRGNSC